MGKHHKVKDPRNRLTFVLDQDVIDYLQRWAGKTGAAHSRLVNHVVAQYMDYDPKILEVIPPRGWELQQEAAEPSPAEEPCQIST